MNTLIVSAFAGCGKTWLTEHQGQYGYTICDTDSSSYDKLTGWEKRYLTDIVKQVESAKYDFIFVCQHDSVLTEMDKQGIPYVIVQPDNIIWNELEAPERKKKRLLIKQQWIGRLVLRDNSHIKDFGKWINHIKEIYDERTSLHFIQSHKQVSFFTLEMDQYLSDIIEDLYWKKEFYDSYSLRTTSTYTPEK
ncbi:MAG: hypothetical protein ACLS8T_18735 [Anaerobutyricum sp.]